MLLYTIRQIKSIYASGGKAACYGGTKLFTIWLECKVKENPTILFRGSPPETVNILPDSKLKVLSFSSVSNWGLSLSCMSLWDV